MRLIFERCGRLLRRCACGLLAAAFLAGLMLPAQASGFTKKETSRAIAIVFDNSGSMYATDGRPIMAWSQATYAMEVFAAMLNEGDKLQIYPMHPIEVDGATFSVDDPLTINGAAEASRIRKIYTPYAGGTPIESITKAYEGLLKLDMDERWLIVLTDGTTFDGYGSGTQAALSELLTEYNRDVNILYLGIGNMALPVVEDPVNTYYAAEATSDRVPAELSGMCNQIFGRNSLPDSNISRDSGHLNFDIPMSKLIIFVQGEGVENITLTSAATGQAVPAVGSYAPKYSTLGAGGNYAGNCVEDTSLEGMIATYAACPAGEYTFSYSGDSRDIAVYYEPDVDLSVTVTDEDGNIKTGSSQLYPGTYRVNYRMAVRGGAETQSPLLGTTDYAVTCVINGVPRVERSSQPGYVEVELAEGDTLDLSAEVTFLRDYRISRSGSELGWDGTAPIPGRPIGELTFQVSGGAASYRLSRLEEEGIYQIAVYYEGAQLTAGDLDRVQIDGTIAGGNAGYALDRTESGFKLGLEYAAGGAADTDCGDYTLSLSASYLNQYGQTAAVSGQPIEFAIEDEAAQLEVDLDIPNGYYVISNLAGGEPMYAYLTMNGVPLTEEQMAQASIEVTGKDLDFIVEPIPGEAGYVIRIDPEGSYKTGFHRFTVTAAAKDQVGREIGDSAEGSVQLRHLPFWLLILIILLIIALISLLIFLFLNTKILPRNVVVKKTTFTVDGAKVAGNAACTYSGGGKKHGSLEINSPRYTPNPLVKCGFRLDLEAVSPRRTRSRARAMRVRGVSAVNAGAVNSIKIGAAQFIRDQNTGKLARAGGKANAPIDFQISSGAACNVVAEVLDGDGGGVSVSLVVKLEYR